MSQPARKQESPTFGLPVTKGKLVAKGAYGVVVRFNVWDLNVRTLVRAGVFSADRQALTEIVSPHLRVTDLFNYPLSPAAPTFAFAQHEHTAVVFIKVPQISFSDKTRVVFWFFRYPIQAQKGDDLLDLPDELIPLAKLQLRKMILQRLGKPVPTDLDREILKETETQKERLGKEGNVQNYYVTDTFEVSQEVIDRLALVEGETKHLQIKRGARKYAPNLRYREVHHERFRELYAEEKSQKVAYDRLVKEFPDDLDPDLFDSFIVQWRKSRK